MRLMRLKTNNMQLDKYDLNWAVRRLPKVLKDIMQSSEWSNRIYVGGGYLRALVAHEDINDIDVFCNNKVDAELLSHKLAENKEDIYTTDNAYTIKGNIPIQIIHRWTFDKPEDVSNSFDFTICCAVIFYKVHSPELSNWDSYCDERFYTDLAAKRLIYRRPTRNEEAGGSMLRLLKYYKKGYRAPLDSIGYIIARPVMAIDTSKIDMSNEQGIGHVLSGLLREVDPNTDPTHEIHIPTLK